MNGMTVYLNLKPLQKILQGMENILKVNNT